MNFNLQKDSKNYNINVSIRYDDKSIVLNNKEDDTWPRDNKVTEGEDRFDFAKGVPVTVKVEAKSESFVVSANERSIAKFRYQKPLSDITAAAFTADVKLESLCIYF